jgi:hypothetical protein
VRQLVLGRNRGFGHAEDGEGFAIGQRDGDGFDNDVSPKLVERNAGERRAHFKADEAGGFGGVFAGFEEKSAEATAGPIGMHEDGADFGGVGSGIQKFRFADGGMVAAEESSAFAPATAGDDGSCAGGGFSFGHEISLVGDELGIEAQNGAKSAFDLFWCVIVRLEDADGGFDEGAQSGDVGGSGEADVKSSGHGMMIRRQRTLATEDTEKRAEDLAQRRGEAAKEGCRQDADGVKWRFHFKFLIVFSKSMIGPTTAVQSSEAET